MKILLKEYSIQIHYYVVFGGGEVYLQEKPCYYRIRIYFKIHIELLRFNDNITQLIRCI